MEIINPGPEDYHMHSSSYSDGMNSVDELVRFAGEIGLRKIAITDHSDALVKRFGWAQKTYREFTERWKNVLNDVTVLFGVEGDILNEDGDVCIEIQGIEGDFLVLSAHDKVYNGDPQRITDAYVRAMQRHHKKIDVIGHPCHSMFAGKVDMDTIIEVANRYEIPLEINAGQMLNKKTDFDNLRILVREAEKVYINSDAHTLYELQEAREISKPFLRKMGVNI
ncbi:PHP domain-containing protein [Candidatus Woesearchaeota archaeon]|jgi:DNA polymerase (family X)|nr:PHP domain-containing protein [Candidatus Woesearchaeota archaeon]MBT6367623.1 PHP domain-containing protein [Candidatus Woesearchaeota archaeon]MBT7762355.1 PHP domain-containing protein [Candidatus Woesearchaeota archaeon]